MKIATIWNTYGRYHLARVSALGNEFSSATLVCLSHCRSNLGDYPFFQLRPPSLRVIVDKDQAELKFWESFSATMWILDQEEPDLILACGYERAETFAALSYARLKSRVCFLMLDNQYDDRPRRWIVEAVKMLYLKFFHGFVYGGDTHRDYLRRLHVPPEHEVYGYNCVDNSAIEQLSAEYRRIGKRLGPENPYFLCVARLIEKKNLLRLLAAYAAYSRTLQGEGAAPWRLVIVGEGPMRPQIEETIEQLDLGSSALLVGQVDAFEDVVNYHTFANAVILPSHHNEQWGLVVNEAMAAGRPVLVSRQCGCATTLVRDGENGFLFDGNSPEEIAERMLWMHRNQDRLESMGTASRRIVAEMSPERFASNVRHLYEIVISKRAAVAR